MENANKAFKATITLGDHVDEVTVYAVSLEEAQEKAVTRFGENAVGRVRPMVYPSVKVGSPE